MSNTFTADAVELDSETMARVCDAHPDAVDIELILHTPAGHVELLIVPAMLIVESEDAAFVRLAIPAMGPLQPLTIDLDIDLPAGEALS